MFWVLSRALGNCLTKEALSSICCMDYFYNVSIWLVSFWIWAIDCWSWFWNDKKSFESFAWLASSLWVCNWHSWKRVTWVLIWRDSASSSLRILLLSYCARWVSIYYMLRISVSWWSCKRFYCWSKSFWSYERSWYILVWSKGLIDSKVFWGSCNNWKVIGGSSMIETG